MPRDDFTSRQGTFPAGEEFSVASPRAERLRNGAAKFKEQKLTEKLLTVEFEAARIALLFGKRSVSLQL